MSERNRGVSVLRVALALLVLGVAALHAFIYSFPFEDAFITFRYARNLARGNGLVYNPGEIVEGYSSFAWTVLLAAVSALRLPLEASAHALSLGFGACMLGLTAQAYARVPNDPDFRPRWPFGLGAALLLACSGTFAFYANTGMETTLFCALLLSAALCLGRDAGRDETGEQPPRAFAAGLLLAAGALTRPEGVGYALVVLAAVSCVRADRPHALRAASGFALVFVPYYAWRFLRYGHWAPNTYYAKASASWPLLLQGVSYAESFLVGRGFLAAYCVALALLVRVPRSSFLRIACAVLFAAVAMSVVVGGDTFAFHRFFLPAIPFAALMLVAALDGATRSGRLLPTLSAVSLVVLASCALIWSEHVPVSTLLETRTRSEYARALSSAELDRDYFVVGRFLREHVLPGKLLALNAAGIVPFESDLPTLDMLGLNDAHIAHLPIQLGRGVIGHEKHDARYVLARKPDLILLGLPVLAPLRFGPDQIASWYARFFRALPGDAQLWRDPELLRDYAPLYVRMDRGVLYALVRRDAGTVLR